MQIHPQVYIAVSGAVQIFYRGVVMAVNILEESPRSRSEIDGRFVFEDGVLQPQG